MMAAMPNATAFHESGHAVAARQLGLQVVRASAAPGRTGVRTRHEIGVPPAQLAATMQKLLLVDLSGPLAEEHFAGVSDELACAKDEANALRRALRLGLWTSARLDEAEELVEHSRPKAAHLVQQAWPAIERVAAALADGHVLTGDQVDALMAAP